MGGELVDILIAGELFALVLMDDEGAEVNVLPEEILPGLRECLESKVSGGREANGIPYDLLGHVIEEDDEVGFACLADELCEVRVEDLEGITN